MRTADRISLCHETADLDLLVAGLEALKHRRTPNGMLIRMSKEKKARVERLLSMLREVITS